MDHQPQPGETLAKPIFDVSTKLEETDRYVTWAEAQKIAGLADAELADVKAVLLKADQTITKAAANAKLTNEDGKIELAFDDIRKIMVVDVLAHWMNAAFTYNGVHVSKEVARQFYKKTAWYNDLEPQRKKAKPKVSKIGKLFARLSRLS